MPTKHVPPSITARHFSCPHCGAFAHQTWFDVFTRPADEELGTPYRMSEGEANRLAREQRIDDETLDAWIELARRTASGEMFQQFVTNGHVKAQLMNVWVSACFSCERLSLWRNDYVIDPPSHSGVPPNDDMPEDVRRDFLEAGSILAASPRGAAALLRLSIQKLCKHFGEPGKNINEDIGSLVKKGLDDRVRKALDIVRVIGNDAVHPGQIDLKDDRDTALKLFGLVNLIVEKMITEEKHINEMFESLPESKLKQIEGRDKDKGPK